MSNSDITVNRQDVLVAEVKKAGEHFAFVYRLPDVFTVVMHSPGSDTRIIGAGSGASQDEDADADLRAACEALERATGLNRSPR
jgi:hypothetical protein